MKNATDQTFDEVIDQSELVLVDFWAPWCGPCRMLGPVLEELDQQMGDKVSIVKINVDENPSVSSRYGIMSIPTLKLFKGGKEVTTVVGVQPIDTLKNMIQQYC